MFEFIVLFINVYLDINFVYFVVDYMKFILLVDWLILKLFVMLNKYLFIGGKKYREVFFR